MKVGAFTHVGQVVDCDKVLFLPKDLNETHAHQDNNWSFTFTDPGLQFLPTLAASTTASSPAFRPSCGRHAGPKQASCLGVCVCS